MNRGLLALLFGTFLLGAGTVLSAATSVPQAARVMLGVLMVFVLPGFALTWSALPSRELSHGERLLVSVGMSLALATCTAVLLAATPIGLSRKSFEMGLGSVTVVLSIVALIRGASGTSLDGTPSVGDREVGR